MSELSNFQYIWKHWIVPLIDDLLSKMDQTFRQECNVKIRNLDKICEAAEKYYQVINYRLAFYGSVVFLFHAMIFEYSRTNSELSKKLAEREKLDLYKRGSNLEKEKAENKKSVKESFENSIVLDLAKGDVGNRSFDYFMYAIILYQLEEHNKNLLIEK